MRAMNAHEERRHHCKKTSASDWRVRVATDHANSHGVPRDEGRLRSLAATALPRGLYLGVILVILLPCTPSPAMSPFWPKMKA